MQAFTFWSPELLNPLRVAEAQDILKETSMPALQTLIAKADAFPVRQDSFYETASYLLHQPVTHPIAAIYAKQLLNEIDEKQFWLKVDPVQMIADRDSLVLIAGKHLAITDEESKQLISTFNNHFKEDGVELFWGDAHNWFLSIKQAIDIHTTPLDKVDHHPINEFLPTGNAAQYWRQLINETQMLFFNHPVNESRREQGYPEVNSVWIWGEGKLDSSQVKVRKDAIMCSKNNYLQGVAKISGAQVLFEEPASFAEFLTMSNNGEAAVNNSKSAVVMLDEYYRELDFMTIEQWQETLLELDKQWFAPLLTALKNKQIQSLLIDVGAQQRYHLKPAHLNRFWRFKKALSKL